MTFSNGLTILLYVALAWFIYTRFAPTKGLKNLKSSEFQQKLNDSPNKVIVDVRETHEFKDGHLPGAVNIPLSKLGARSGEIPKDKEVFLYCRSGMRSKQAGRILSKQGFNNLAHLQGGIMSWNGKVVK